MPDTLENPPETATAPKRKPPAHPPEVRELAKSLYIQGFGAAQISRRLGISHTCARHWIERYQWDKIRAKTLENLSVEGQEVMSMTLARKSVRARQGLASELQALIEGLRELAVKPQLSHISDRAETANKLAAAADRVFAWSEERKAGMIIEMRQVESQPAPAPTSGGVLELQPPPTEAPGA